MHLVLVMHPLLLQFILLNSNPAACIGITDFPSIASFAKLSAIDSIIQIINEYTEKCHIWGKYCTMLCLWNVPVSASSLLRLTGQAWCEQRIILPTCHDLREVKLCQVVQAWGVLSIFRSSADEGPPEVQGWKDSSLKHQCLFHATRGVIFAILPSLCLWV